MRDHVRRALESGVGLYHTTWRLDDEPQRSTEATAAELIEWCRDILGRIHRPYGLDQVTLALAVLGGDNQLIASANYGVLRPIDFYAAGPAETQILHTLRQWAENDTLACGRLSAVLFSWGDLTRELLVAS